MNCVNHPDAQAVKECIVCGNPICGSCQVEVKHELYCKKCVAAKIEGRDALRRSPELAAMLSALIGGAGQIYNGQIGKGVLIFFTSWLIIPWIYGVFDAYKTAQKICDGAITPKKNVGCLTVFILVPILIVGSIAIIGIIAVLVIPRIVGSSRFSGASRRVIMYHASGTDDQEEVLNNTVMPSFAPSQMKIYLKNGSHVSGRVVKEEDGGYWLSIGGAETFFSKDEINTVTQSREKK